MVEVMTKNKTEFAQSYEAHTRMSVLLPFCKCNIVSFRAPK